MLPVADAKRGSGSGIAVLPIPFESLVFSGMPVIVMFSVTGEIVGCM